MGDYPTPRTSQGRWLLNHQRLVNIGRLDGAMRGDEIDLRQSVLTIEAEAMGAATDCPIVGVHGHAFHGPHQFREWEPGEPEARQPPADRKELREFVFDILHRGTCADNEPHPWTDHLPWDDPEDEPNSIALADELIAALGSVSPDVGRLRRALLAAEHLVGYGWPSAQRHAEVLAAEYARLAAEEIKL